MVQVILEYCKTLRDDVVVYHLTKAWLPAFGLRVVTYLLRLFFFLSYSVWKQYLLYVLDSFSSWGDLGLCS